MLLVDFLSHHLHTRLLLTVGCSKDGCKQRCIGHVCKGKDGQQGGEARVCLDESDGLKSEGTGLFCRHIGSSVQPYGPSSMSKFMTTVLQCFLCFIFCSLLPSLDATCKASPSFLASDLALGFAKKDTV